MDWNKHTNSSVYIYRSNALKFKHREIRNYGTLRATQKSHFLCYIHHLLIDFIFLFSGLELYKQFQEEAYSIALHPSGLFILVGFSDKLRLMNLLIDDVRPFKEFTIRGCREVTWEFQTVDVSSYLFFETQCALSVIICCAAMQQVVNLGISYCSDVWRAHSVSWSNPYDSLVALAISWALFVYLEPQSTILSIL